MELLQTLILSVVQGVGEFLPISSSANLDIVSKIFSIGEFDFGMKVTLHAGSLIALIVHFRKTLWNIILGIFTNKVKLSQTALSTLVLATIPVVFIGVIAHNFVKSFNSQIITGVFLIVFGVFLWLSDVIGGNKLTQRCTKHTYVRDCCIGVFQSLAVLPGVSRLGICTTACRLFNMTRRQAISTSLLLAIPSITGSLCIETINILKSDLPFVFTVNHILGIIITGLVGVIALPICIKYMERHGFFGIMCYRVILGLVTIFLL